MFRALWLRLFIANSNKLVRESDPRPSRNLRAEKGVNRMRLWSAFKSHMRENAHTIGFWAQCYSVRFLFRKITTRDEAVYRNVTACYDSWNLTFLKLKLIEIIIILVPCSYPFPSVVPKSDAAHATSFWQLMLTVSVKRYIRESSLS